MKRKPPLIPLTQVGTLLLVWFAFLFLLLFLTACSPDAATLMDAVEQAADAPLTFLVDPEPVTDSVSAADGTLLAACAYQLPLMTVLRRDGTAVTEEDAASGAERSALETATAFNGQFRRWAAEADFAALASAARQDYALQSSQGQAWTGNYSQALNCTVYQSDRLVSVSGLFDYNGGSHPRQVYLGWNFDTRTGTFVAPDQLFDNLSAVTEELVRLAEERANQAGMEPEAYFWPDFRNLLADWDAAAVTFDETHMTVSWGPYDLAGYEQGEQRFFLPLSQLSPYLNSYGRDLLNVL